MKNNKRLNNPWKALRERAGLTQREVSDALGYSTPQFISNVERGRCRFPIEKMAKVRKMYRLSVEQAVNLILSEQRIDLLKAFNKRA